MQMSGTGTNPRSCEQLRSKALTSASRRRAISIASPVYPTTSSRVQDDAVMSPARFVPAHYPSAAQFPSFVNSLPILRAAATLNGIRANGGDATVKTAVWQASVTGKDPLNV